MSFKDIKGQAKAIEILQEYIKHSRLTGSYLFTGEEGIGKRLTARALAKAVNCQEENLDSCDKCQSCLKIENGRHPDVHIIDASVSGEENDSIKIESIRQLQKEINFRPYEGKRKVFIIDNAHNLTPDAANALLKILEEPVAMSLIILISAKPSLLFKTIISRCKALKFYPMQRAALEGALKADFGLDSDHAHYLAYFSEGRIGQALKLKDTDILRDKNMVIDAFAPGRTAAQGNLAVENRNSVRAYLNILAGWFRDLYLVKIGAPSGELINLDRKGDLSEAVHNYTFADLYEIFNSISNSLLYLDRNINVRLLLSNLREAATYGAK